MKAAERSALARAAKEHGTSPANWLRSLALAHLTRTPHWNPNELQALRDVFTELRRIGVNLNQVAHALNLAVKAGQVPLEGAQEAQWATDAVRVEMRRVVGLMTGNFAYWGVPQDPDPKPSADARAQAAATRPRGRPRRRSPRFADP